MGGFVNDGVGQTAMAATPLPFVGDTIDSSIAVGVIVPNSVAAPNPTGSANYTDYYWLFASTGGTATITANSGRSTIIAGTPDPVQR